jgi:hypothetical protein
MSAALKCVVIEGIRNAANYLWDMCHFFFEARQLCLYCVCDAQWAKKVLFADFEKGRTAAQFF